jgi:hypothetical protein
VGLLIYFIVAMVLRKTVAVELGLCSEHMAKHGKERFDQLVTHMLWGRRLYPDHHGGGQHFVVPGILLLLGWKQSTPSLR